ncbi:MAG: hypothetical protein HC890_12590 [Chloroflexaceae bacterium]|nr:hypothetical protein [Chloroflexaceae bacterium]
MALVVATVKHPAEVSAFGRVKESKFNPGQSIQSIKFVSLDGTIEHWATFPSEVTREFKMFDRFLLVPISRGGKDTFDVEVMPNNQPAANNAPSSQPERIASASPAPTAAPEFAGIDIEQKRVIAAWVSGQADLYAFCFLQARRVLSTYEPTPEQVQGCASSLFISTMRKFNLER